MTRFPFDARQRIEQGNLLVTGVLNKSQVGHLPMFWNSRREGPYTLCKKPGRWSTPYDSPKVASVCAVCCRRARTDVELQLILRIRKTLKP